LTQLKFGDAFASWQMTHAKPRLDRSSFIT
jgi:hypothetical protein